MVVASEVSMRSRACFDWHNDSFGSVKSFSHSVENAGSNFRSVLSPPLGSTAVQGTAVAKNES